MAVANETEGRSEGELARSVEDKKSKSTSHFNSRTTAFVGLMGALGLVLSYLSNYLQISVGPGQTVSLDLSHVGTFVVAVAAGPLLGMVTGAIVGLLPAFNYANPALVPGKMLTGFAVGYLFNRLNAGDLKDGSKLTRVCLVLAAGTLGYLPEFAFTVWDTKLVLGFIPDFILVGIYVKAPVEIVAISVLTGTLLSNGAVQDGLQPFLAHYRDLERKRGVVVGEGVGLAIVAAVTVAFYAAIVAAASAFPDYLWLATWAWTVLLVAIFAAATLVVKVKT
ncbi:MAG: hypothetical protein Kow0069_19370 [Promethearchaeota archaeon]